MLPRNVARGPFRTPYAGIHVSSAPHAAMGRRPFVCRPLRGLNFNHRGFPPAEAGGYCLPARHAG